MNYEKILKMDWVDVVINCEIEFEMKKIEIIPNEKSLELLCFAWKFFLKNIIFNIKYIKERFKILQREVKYMRITKYGLQLVKEESKNYEVTEDIASSSTSAVKLLKEIFKLDK